MEAKLLSIEEKLDALQLQSNELKALLEKVLNSKKTLQTSTNPQHPSIIINQFGQEDYTHLIKSGFINELIKDTIEFRNALRTVVKKLFCDPEHPENSTVHLENGSYNIYIQGKWKQATNKTPILKKIKQRANTILQYYLMTNGKEQEMFKKYVGDNQYKQLDDFTYSIDTIEDFPEFDEETNQDIEGIFEEFVHQP